MTQYPSRFHLPWWLVCILVLSTLLTSQVSAQPAPPAAASPIMVPNPATDLWRAVRQRDALAAGRSQVRGPESGVLIQKAGEDFRNYRRQDFIGNAGLFIGGMAAVIAVFYLLKGRIMIPDGRTGRVVRRFADIDRVTHWVTAITFIVLAITGLTLLFGRFIFIPLIGPEAFGAVANAFKPVHDYVSPVFIVSLIVLIVRFAAKNMPAKGDIKWIVTGGGIIGKGHASAGYFNAGEKIWFWGVFVFGIVVSASGLFLLFPIFDQSRETMQLALIVHGISAVLFVGGSLGHIYIGTIGTEGSLESMTTGYVDENWAKAHHDRWYEDVKDHAVSRDQVTSKETSGDARPASST